MGDYAGGMVALVVVAVVVWLAVAVVVALFVGRFMALGTAHLPDDG